METKQVPSLKLNNGREMPIVGLGTFLTKDKDNMTELLTNAIKIGYRHFDTAILYENEKFIGESLEKIFSTGLVKREELFITTKFLPKKGLPSMVDSLKQSLKDLKLEYVDLYLVHWPVAHPTKELAMTNRPQYEVWREMEECSKLGLAKAIGISNFNVQSVMNILSLCEIKPAVNQIEIHPFLPQEGLVETCQRLGIVVTGYSTLARGGNDATRVFGDKIDIFNQPKLVEISKKYNKTVAQIVLRWAVQRKIVVIPKSDKIERLKENFDLFSFELTQQEIEGINSLNQNLRTINPRLLESWSNFPVFD